MNVLVIYIAVSLMHLSVCSSFSVCGRIAVSRLPEGMKQQGRYKVTLTPSGQDKAATTESDHMGAFCFQARPGEYSIQVGCHSTETADCSTYIYV